MSRVSEVEAWFSTKSAGALAAMGTAIVLFAHQIELVASIPMVLTVTAICVIAAVPFAWISARCSPSWGEKMATFIVSFLISWYAIFQSTRGSGATIDSVIPNTPPDSVSHAAVVPFAFDAPRMSGILTPPFRPEARWENDRWEVLVVVDGKRVWAESVQKETGTRF